MTRPDQAAIPLVRKHLPDEPLDAFLDRNWVPVLLVSHPTTRFTVPDGFCGLA